MILIRYDGSDGAEAAIQHQPVYLTVIRGELMRPC